jgi:hypothetical protein
MSTPNDNSIALKNNERLSYSLNVLELGFAVIVGVAIWIGLRNFLHLGYANEKPKPKVRKTMQELVRYERLYYCWRMI